MPHLGTLNSTDLWLNTPTRQNKSLSSNLFWRSHLKSKRASCLQPANGETNVALEEGGRGEGRGGEGEGGAVGVSFLEMELFGSRDAGIFCQDDG